MINNKYILALIYTLVISYSQAHSPTEIGFKFTEENQRTYLQVHLTTSTLFDLLYDLKPELRSRESLNLNRFTSDYENYFNRNIDLRLNGKDQKLEYVDSNLIIHDATITFLIQDLQESITDYTVSVGGFEFYGRPRFTLLFDTSSITDNHFLSRSNNTCSSTDSASMVDTENGPHLPHWVLITGGVSILLLLIYRRRMQSYAG